jgi:trehalose 6-phosphate synthase
MPLRSRFVVVANRLPAHRVQRGKATVWQRSPGGLVTALTPVLTQRHGVWVGWDGAAGRVVRPGKADGIGIGPVKLSRQDVSEFYEGFCNASIWPLYHDAIQKPEFHRTWWGRYREVNAKFAAAVGRHASRGATVWVHDYHLQLLPAMLREKRPDLKIGYFLHIPFPPEELFAWLPWRAALLRGLMGADVVGFQTEASSQNFSRAARRWTPAEGVDRELQVNGRRVKVRPCPISIDAVGFADTAREYSVRRRAQEVRESLGGRRIILGVDRLDYTKGIPHRLAAFEELFRDGRVSVDDTVFVQVAVPSREESMGYREIRREVEEMVGRINGQFSEPGRVAVHYFRRSLSREELAAYYLAADVMLVTPLRDGMNLVAKEYVACREDLGGVLVLSEFAGAAWELRRAMLVNPRDIDGLKNVIMQALRMPEKDRRMRMSILRAQVHRHDVHEWASMCLGDLP